MFERPLPGSAPNSQQDAMNLPCTHMTSTQLSQEMPEDLGGAGLGISEATMMLQTISQSATQPVAKFAKEDQRKSMLPRLISGEWKACFKVTEPRSGE